jgi:hypothetical protein
VLFFQFVLGYFFDLGFEMFAGCVFLRFSELNIGFLCPSVSICAALSVEVVDNERSDYIGSYSFSNIVSCVN